jgi:DNA damage-binding protein 1
VSILSLENLQAINTVSVADESIPRSLLLTQVFDGQMPTLFIAMADGNVITYSVDLKSFALTGKKSIILGTQQANFSALPRGDGSFNVFAACDHPSLIYASEGRLVYSAITADKASAVCSFDSAFYPGAIAIATPEELRIGMVDTERTTHVQTLLVSETVRRIAYSPSTKTFGMGTIKRTLSHGVETIQSHFKVADEILFKELDTFSFNRDELVESVIRCELDAGSGDGSTAERFVVGTAYLDDDRADALRGRILIFEVTEDRMLKLVTELETKGGCRCLGMVEGRIVAALIKTVRVHGWFHLKSLL